MFRHSSVTTNHSAPLSLSQKSTSNENTISRFTKKAGEFFSAMIPTSLGVNKANKSAAPALTQAQQGLALRETRRTQLSANVTADKSQGGLNKRQEKTLHKENKQVSLHLKKGFSAGRCCLESEIFLGSKFSVLGFP